jgi:ADP-ribosylglycohydrolase
MTQEELIREVGKVIPNGMYSEEVIQLAFTMFTHGYNYAVEKAVEFLKEKEFGDWIEQEASSFIEDFRKAMEE